MRSKQTDSILIQGDRVIITTPEGVTFEVPLPVFLKLLAVQRPNSGRMILPHGVKSFVSRGEWTIFVYERPPGPMPVRWIAPDSPADFGPGTTYREYLLAMPFIVLLVPFAPRSGGMRTLNKYVEIFWRKEPLTDIDKDLLDYPCLLNASLYDPAIADAKPLSWLCVQYMSRDFERLTDDKARFRGAWKALLDVLLATAFNRSSEHNEAASWYTEYQRRGCDARFSSPEAWQEATRQDRFWTLDNEVEFISTGKTVAEVMERMFSIRHAQEPKVTNACELARLVINQARHEAIRRKTG